MDPLVNQMRLFHLHREVDDSGTSGTGNVAEGVIFSDGTVALRWRGALTSVAFYASIADVVKVHGHNGHTIVEVDR